MSSGLVGKMRRFLVILAVGVVVESAVVVHRDVAKNNVDVFMPRPLIEGNFNKLLRSFYYNYWLHPGMSYGRIPYDMERYVSHNYMDPLNYQDVVENPVFVVTPSQFGQNGFSVFYLHNGLRSLHNSYNVNNAFTWLREFFSQPGLKGLLFYPNLIYNAQFLETPISSVTFQDMRMSDFRTTQNCNNPVPYLFVAQEDLFDRMHFENIAKVSHFRVYKDSRIEVRPYLEQSFGMQSQHGSWPFHVSHEHVPLLHGSLEFHVPVNDMGSASASVTHQPGNVYQDKVVTNTEVDTKGDSKTEGHSAPVTSSTMEQYSVVQQSVLLPASQQLVVNETSSESNIQTSEVQGGSLNVQPSPSSYSETTVTSQTESIDTKGGSLNVVHPVPSTSSIDERYSVFLLPASDKVVVNRTSSESNLSVSGPKSASSSNTDTFIFTDQERPEQTKSGEVDDRVSIGSKIVGSAALETKTSTGIQGDSSVSVGQGGSTDETVSVSVLGSDGLQGGIHGENLESVDEEISEGVGKLTQTYTVSSLGDHFENMGPQGVIGGGKGGYTVNKTTTVHSGSGLEGDSSVSEGQGSSSESVLVSVSGSGGLQGGIHGGGNLESGEKEISANVGKLTQTYTVSSSGDHIENVGLQVGLGGSTITNTTTVHSDSGSQGGLDGITGGNLAFGGGVHGNIDGKVGIGGSTVTNTATVNSGSGLQGDSSLSGGLDGSSSQSVSVSVSGSGGSQGGIHGGVNLDSIAHGISEGIGKLTQTYTVSSSGDHIENVGHQGGLGVSTITNTTTVTSGSGLQGESSLSGGLDGSSSKSVSVSVSGSGGSQGGIHGGVNLDSIAHGISEGIGKLTKTYTVSSSGDHSGHIGLHGGLGDGIGGSLAFGGGVQGKVGQAIGGNVDTGSTITKTSTVHSGSRIQGGLGGGFGGNLGFGGILEKVGQAVGGNLDIGGSTITKTSTVHSGSGIQGGLGGGFGGNLGLGGAISGGVQGKVGQAIGGNVDTGSTITKTSTVHSGSGIQGGLGGGFGGNLGFGGAIIGGVLGKVGQAVGGNVDIGGSTITKTSTVHSGSGIEGGLGGGFGGNLGLGGAISGGVLGKVGQAVGGNVDAGGSTITETSTVHSGSGIQGGLGGAFGGLGFGKALVSSVEGKVDVGGKVHREGLFW